jgi:hypothetical protein
MGRPKGREGMRRGDDHVFMEIPLLQSAQIASAPRVTAPP